jgi:hypothetical protein
MIGPQEDPYRKAARLYLDGDIASAWIAIEDTIREKAREDYRPSREADEDGEWIDYEGPAHSEVSYAITSAAEYISDAVYEIMTQEQGVDDQTAQDRSVSSTSELDSLWQKNVDEIVSEIVEEYKDGADYARDPYAYHGVSREDFF